MPTAADLHIRQTMAINGFKLKVTIDQYGVDALCSFGDTVYSVVHRDLTYSLDSLVTEAAFIACQLPTCKQLTQP